MQAYKTIQSSAIASAAADVKSDIMDAHNQRLRKRAERKAARAEMSVPLKVWTFAMNHKVILACAILVIAITVTAIASALNPEPAEAIAPLIIAGIAAIVGGLGVGIAVDAVSNALQDVLRDACNMLLYNIQTISTTITNSDFLTKSFDGMISEVYPFVQQVWQQAAVPLANTVLIIFFVVGIMKVVSNLNNAELGIDLWSLIWVFIAFAFCKTLIDSSFALMVAAYNLVTQFITAVTSVTSSGVAGVTIATIPDTVTNAGLLLVLLICLLICMLIMLAVALVSQVVMIVRSIQIYTYTAFAAIPLAFLVSESSRSMATGFIKRYMAILFAGAIMAFLFICMSLMSNGLTMATGAANSGEEAVTWICQIMFSLVSYIAFAYCIFKSGAWAREFVGL